MALSLLLGAGYVHVTRPSALRARLASLFGQFDLRLVQVGDISFSPWAGLEVRNLRVVAAENSPLANRTGVPNPPPLLRVPRAHVRIDPWALLLGKVRPRDVELDTPAIAVIAPNTGAPAPRRQRAPDRVSSLGGAPADLPRVRIKAADIEVFSAENGRLRLLRRWVVDGEGALVRGEGTEPCSYALRLDQVAGSVSAKRDRNLPLAEVRWQAGQLTAELGWVDLELVQALLPPEWRPSLRHLHLAGQARARQLVFERDRLASADLHFDDLRFCVPIEGDVGGVPDEHFAHVTDAAGTLSYVAREPIGSHPPASHGGDLHLQISGRLNQARTGFSLALFDAGYTASDSGERVETFGVKGLRAGTYEMSLQVEGLTLPTAVENPRFVSAQRVPGAIRSAFRKYNAAGPVNLRLELACEAASAGTPHEASHQTTIQYSGELEALGASARYYRFPYVIDDVRGFVRFSNDGIRIEGLHGRHGPGRIRFDGALVDTKSWTGFELTCRGYNIASDNDLYAALPTEYQQLWEHAAPIGLCDVQTRLSRPHGSEEQGILETEIRVDARLLSGSLSLLDGSRLAGVDGLIHIAGGKVRLEDLHGYLQDAPVRVNGELALNPGDERPQYDVHVEVANAALQRTTVVRDSEGQPIGEIRFEGVGDIWGHVSSSAPAPNHYAVHVTDGAVTGFDAGLPWTQANGWVVLAGDEQRILSLHALRPDGELAVSGTLPTQHGLDAPIVLDLHADDARLEQLLPDLVPGRWSEIRAALGLAGRGTFAARVYPQAVDKARTRQAADIQLTAASMRPTPLPLNLRDVEARLTLRGDGFDLHQAVADYGDNGRFAVSGQGGWTAGDTWSNLSVEASELELDSELLQALPARLAALLEDLKPQGHLDLDLDQLRLAGSQQRTWNVAGQVLLKRAALDIGVPLTEFDGHLRGRCEIRPDGQVNLEAVFAIDRGRLSARPLERCEGRLRCYPGSRRVQLEDVRGRLCDGEIVGFVEIDPDTATYELSFTLHDVSLDQLLQRRESDSGETRQGRVDGHVFVRGSTKDPTRRSGGGELRVRGASLLSHRVTASVLTASRQRQHAISAEVDQAELLFAWEGQEVKLSRIDIHSRDLRLIGMGDWNLRSDAIRMTLLGATPEDAPRLSLLTDLLESAGQELIQYRIEGTAAKPRVTIEPLHNLTDPLRKLLRRE